MEQKRGTILKRKNSFGICEWVLPETGADAIRHAAKLGYEGIQLTERGGSTAGYPLMNPIMQDVYRKAVDETGITLQTLHLWTLCRQAASLHPVGTPAFQIAVDSVRNGIAVCKQLHIPSMLLTSGFMSQIKNEKDFLQFGNFLRFACEEAGEQDVRIVFESALTSPEIVRMLDMVDGLYVCFDAFNPVRFAIGDALEQLKQLPMDRIDHFHLKDGPANCVGCTLLGEGIGGFAALADYINTTSYQGWFITENYYLEPPVGDGTNFDLVAQEDLRRMKCAFGGSHG